MYMHIKIHHMKSVTLLINWVGGRRQNPPLSSIAFTRNIMSHYLIDIGVLGFYYLSLDTCHKNGCSGRGCNCTLKNYKNYVYYINN